MKVFSLGRIYLDYILKRPEPDRLPHRLWVEPTNHCNLRCIICPNSNEGLLPSRGFMDFEMFKDIIDEASGFAYDINLFHRGESLLHPKIYEMIEYVSRRGLISRLHTNATILTEENAERIFDSGLHYISISFDGYDRDTYEGIRKGASFEKTYGNLVEFLGKKKGKGAKKPFTVLQVIEVWNEPRKIKNEKRRLFMEAFNGLPLDKLSIRVPHNWAGSYRGGPAGNRVSSLCTFPWYSLTIFWDGEVVPCPQDFYGNLSMGNIREGGIKEIWRNDRLITHRKTLIKGSIEGLDPCCNCDMLRRKTFLGVPTNYLTTFLRENL
jgi:radical SAM protein with 4Fe4S-binding SPASM domain